MSHNTMPNRDGNCCGDPRKCAGLDRALFCYFGNNVLPYNVIAMAASPDNYVVRLECADVSCHGDALRHRNGQHYGQ